MKAANYFPRILIVYHACINKKDQHGVSIRGWFADWPTESLAQIYSGGETEGGKFCKYNFKIGSNERKFGNLFFKLKTSPLAQSSYTIPLNNELDQIKKVRFWRIFKNKIGNWLIHSGIWELVFKPKISNEMVGFIEQFQPEIIYCQGYSLTFTKLPLMLRKKFGIPICFQSGDDWPSSLYKNSPIAFIIRPLVDKAVRALLLQSGLRLANGKPMALEYEKRYGVHFEVVMMCDDRLRFEQAIPHTLVGNNTVSIIYTGNFARQRWLSVLELCEAAKKVSVEEKCNIEVFALATSIPPMALNKLKLMGNLVVLPAPAHDDLPSYLKGADILFLPESFNSKLADEIRLSISTKAHFYMMSEKPILVYAPPITGIVNYARSENWAHIVAEHDVNALKAGLRTLIIDKDYCAQLIKEGNDVARKNHDEYVVRSKLHTLLNALAE